MADPGLTPRTAFGATEAMLVRHGQATLCERPDFAIASVAARKGHGPAVAAHIEALCHAPCPVSGYAFGADHAAFWSAPEQWFVMTDFARYQDLAATLASDLGQAASITGQSDGWTVFDLSGPDLSAILERLANIDLAALTEGRAQRTVIEHISCFVLCRTPGQAYRLLCGRSFAGSFAQAVGTAMQSAQALSDPT